MCTAVIHRDSQQTVLSLPAAALLLPLLLLPLYCRHLKTDSHNEVLLNIVPQANNSLTASKTTEPALLLLLLLLPRRHLKTDSDSEVLLNIFADEIHRAHQRFVQVRQQQQQQQQQQQHLHTCAHTHHCIMYAQHLPVLFFHPSLGPFTML
jgi:hypothetical protein